MGSVASARDGLGPADGEGSAGRPRAGRKRKSVCTDATASDGEGTAESPATDGNAATRRAGAGRTDVDAPRATKTIAAHANAPRIALPGVARTGRRASAPGFAANHNP